MNDKLETKKRKPVILVVLGPHRSGTSALTGVLSHLGASLPEHLMPANDGNAVGYFESSRVKSFNDKLLAELGSNWHDISPLALTSVPDQVRDSFLEEAVALLKKEFADARIPLLKDPRICRFVPFWREVFERAGYQPVYIHTHRNPLETAQSIAARHPILVEMGLLIWMRHVLDAEAATRNAPRAFTNYRALLENWREQIAKIEAATGFILHRKTPAVQQTIDAFLTEGLRHQNRKPEDVQRSPQVANLVRETFEILESWVDGVSAPEDYAKLDSLREQLDGAVGPLATFVNALEESNSTRTSLGVQLGELEEQLQGRSLEAEQLSETVKALKASKLQIEEDRQRLETELISREEKIRALQEETSTRIGDLEGQLRQRGLEAEQWFEENREMTERLKESTQRFETDLHKRDEEIRALKENVEERIGEITRLSEMVLKTGDKLTTERTQRAQLQREVVAARQEEVDARKRVEALLASTSWRVTAPIRLLSTLIRR